MVNRCAIAPPLYRSPSPVGYTGTILIERYMSFLPTDYSPPQSDGKYCKLKQGSNRLRILEPPILGYLVWVDKQPKRSRTLEECPIPSDPKDSPKHFWALKIYNFDLKRVQVLEVTQQTIMVPLTELSRNSDWGDPTKYSLTIYRSGEGLETNYLVTPAPHKPLDEDVLKVIRDTPVNLNALYDGGDPFEAVPNEAQPSHVQSDAQQQARELDDF